MFPGFYPSKTSCVDLNKQVLLYITLSLFFSLHTRTHKHDNLFLGVHGGITVRGVLFYSTNTHTRLEMTENRVVS